MLTAQQQADALTVLDAQIPATQSVGANGRYLHVLLSSMDGVHIVGLDEYLGPHGIGYVRWVERADDTGRRWRYMVHVGPEDRPSGQWVDVTPRAGP